MVNLREAAVELWRSLKHEPPRPLLHHAYERIRVEHDTRGDLESLLGPSPARYYMARHEGGETIEFVTDPDSDTVLAKKYIAVTLGDRGTVTGCDMRFESTLRVVREIVATRVGAKRIRPRGPGKPSAHPRTLLEWFTGAGTERLLGRGRSADAYYINGRPIRPRAYRTLLASEAGDDLVVEIRTSR